MTFLQFKEQIADAGVGKYRSCPVMCVIYIFKLTHVKSGVFSGFKSTQIGDVCFILWHLQFALLRL